MRMLPGGAILLAAALAAAAAPAPRIPRTVNVTANAHACQEWHAGEEPFTTTNRFVVTDEGVLAVDGQGAPQATKRPVDAIAKIGYLRRVRRVDARDTAGADRDSHGASGVERRAHVGPAEAGPSS